MDVIPVLRMTGGLIAGSRVDEAVRTWVDAGFDLLQLVDVDSLGGGPADTAEIARAAAAARPEARIGVMVGWQDPDGLGEVSHLDADRIILNLDRAQSRAAVTDCLERNPGRVWVDLPLVDGSTVAAWPLDDDLAGAVRDLDQWGVAGVVLNALDATGPTMATAAAVAGGVTDSEVLLRVAPGRLQRLHGLFTQAAGTLTGIIIDPAESVLDVAEMAVALQDRLEIRRQRDTWKDHYFGPAITGVPMPLQGLGPDPHLSPAADEGPDVEQDSGASGD